MEMCVMCGKKKQFGKNQRAWKNVVVILISTKIKHTAQQRRASTLQPLCIFTFKYSESWSSQKKINIQS